MSSRTIHGAFSALLFLPTLAPCGLLAQSEPKAAPTPDPALPEQLKRLAAMAKDRTCEQDFLAMNLITAISQDPGGRHPKDRKAIVEAMGAVFRLGPVREPDKAQLYRATAQAMGNMGKDAAPAIRKAFEQDRIDGKSFAFLRAELATALGRTKDDKQIPWLLDQALRSPDDAVMAAAGEALGEFEDMPLGQLRDVTRRLISRMGEIDMLASQPQALDPNAPIDFGPQNARQTLDAIAASWNKTLQRLTGQQHEQAAEWQRWLNKNKDWRPPAKARKGDDEAPR